VLPPLAAGNCGSSALLPEERRVLRRLAVRDGSQGTSADDEVAVVGNSRSECRSGPQDEPEPGPSACVGDVTTLSSEAAGELAGAWLATAERSVGRSGTGTVGLQWDRVDAVIEERLESQPERE